MLFFLEELQWVWWILLFLMAYYFYNWAQEHLAFSPLLALVVAAILIYFLVIVYPLAGMAFWFTSVIIFSGVMYMAGIIAPFLFRFTRK